MAELDFRIGRQGDVTALVFKQAVDDAIGILREFDAALSGRQMGALRWVVDSLGSNGDLWLGFNSRFAKSLRHKQDFVAHGGAVASSFLSGFDAIENRSETPAYLTESGLNRAQHLAGLIGRDGTSGFTFTAAGKSVAVTAKSAENLRQIIPIKRTSIGSVEGRLTAINVRNKPKFVVYHAITNKGISCEFDEDRWMETVKNCLGSRVRVVGRLHKNVNGDTLRATVQTIEPVDMTRRFHQPERPDLVVPDFADADSTEEYLRRIRG